MRIVDPRVWLPALALVALACAPCRRPGPEHGFAMARPCGADACGYQSKCFSDGAIHLNDGACQACAGGKWVSATGCREGGCHEGCGKMGKSTPCEHEHQHGKRKP